MSNPQRTYRWKSIDEFSLDARQLLFKFDEHETANAGGRQADSFDDFQAKLGDVGGQETRQEPQTGAQEREVRSAATPLERAYK